MPQTIKRQNWGQQHQILPKLDLIELQRDSYQEFLDSGVREALNEINGDRGIEDFKIWSISIWPS